MPDSPEVEQNFNAPVYGVAGKVENQIIYASSQKQDLAEAAAEIQRLLKQLEETNPTATEKQKEAYINAAVSTPIRKRLLGAFISGGKTALEEFLDNPYLNVTMALIEGWKTAE